MGDNNSSGGGNSYRPGIKPIYKNEKQQGLTQTESNIKIFVDIEQEDI